MTGRCFLEIIAKKDQPTIKAVITRRIAAGALIWTDGFSSYKWLGARSGGGSVRRGTLSAVSGYRWDWVNHRRGEFSRPGVDGATPTVVSTNAVEGVFSRFKRFKRGAGITKVSQNQYGLFMGEFLWHEKFLSRRLLGSDEKESAAFLKFCDLLAAEVEERVVKIPL